MSHKFFAKVENLNPAFRWRDVPRAIWYFLEEEKAKFVVAFVALFLIFFYDLVPAYIAGKVVDFFAHFQKGDSLRLFYFYSVFLGVSYSLASLIRLKSKNTLSQIGHRARTRARVWGFERLTEFSLQWHAKENTGSKIQRIYTGSQSLRDMMAFVRKDFLRISASIIGVTVVFLFLDISFVIFIFAFLAIFFALEYRYNRRIMKLSDEFNIHNQSAGGVFVEGAGNILALKAMGGEHAAQQKVRSHEEITQDLSIRKSNTGFAKWRIFQMVNGLALIVFFLLIGRGVLHDAITAGTILVLFTYFLKMREAAFDISELNETVIDLKSDIGNMMPIFWEQIHVPTGQEKFPEVWKTIEIAGGTMAYPSGQIGLKNLGLVIHHGEKLGIAGSSGSGKSTLVKVLLGLYRLQDGDFTVGHQDYYAIAHDDLLRHMAVVLQETELFNISLRENITMMREEDTKLLRQALAISQLDEVVSKLPLGLDTLIGERGYMLSGGERQRLGIARAIYKNAEIMILDEATSSLDSETERKIMEQLLGEFGKARTLVIVAHRLSTIAHTDRVAVFESASIVEEGTYEKLLHDPRSALAKLNKNQHESTNL